MQIKNFSNYEIFPNEGKIWSYKTNRWIGNKDKKGYWQCHLYGDDGSVWNTKVHRVIWTAVNGAIPTDMQINHLDENKDNCSITNLNLMTCKENNNWGTRNERMAKALSKALKGHSVSTETKERISKANKGKFINRKDQSKPVGAYKNGVLIMTFPSTSEAQRNGYNGGNISACCNGLRQTHKGYQWQYI